MEDCHAVEGNSVTTVEIRVRTLDSSNYTVRVDKDLPVPALKDQLAPVVGVPPQNQRLICRGRVLKDDQLLSSYNVEDGHTLHLVPRPAPSTDEASQANPESAGTSRGRHGQVTHSLLLGTINIPEASEGAFPDLNRIISAVLNSVGSATGASPEGRRGVAVVHSASGIPASSTASPPPSEGPNRQQPAASSNSAEGFQFRNLEAPSDALTTLSHYLSRLEQVFAENGYAALGQQILSLLSRSPRSGAAPATPPNLSSRPLPTPAALGATISRVQQLFHDQVSAAFTNLAGQLSNEPSLDDAISRADLQSNAVWSGNVMQQLGALLLELGRTTMTLRLGPTPAQAVVNSGPAIFVSSSGPNPMMVQPTPFGAFSFASPQADIGAVPAPRNVSVNVSGNDIGRRAFPLFSTTFQHNPTSTESVAAPSEANISDGAGNQAAEAGPGDHESEPSLGLLVQDNGSVRIFPVRGRPSTTPPSGVSIHSRIQTGFRGLRTGPDSAIAVPVLGIRAQVHTDQWTQAVLHASEGQRPVGIALTIPVDVASGSQGVAFPVDVGAPSQADAEPQQSPPDLDSILAAYRVRREAANARGEVSEQTIQNRSQADHDGAQSSRVEGGSAQKIETEATKTDNEDGQRKRGAEERSVNGGAGSCTSSGLQTEDSQSSEAKRRKL